MRSFSPRRRFASVRSFLSPPSFTELELQARWFAGDFGKSFIGTAGEKIEIVQFGTWNRETGPDFSDAAVRIDRGATLRGSVEFDLADRNWEMHGHASNPAFDETVLHVFVESGERTFFSRTTVNRDVPQVRVDPTALPVRFFHQPAAGPPGTLSRAAPWFAGGKNLQHSRRRGAVSPAAQNASLATTERAARG